MISLLLCSCLIFLSLIMVHMGTYVTWIELGRKNPRWFHSWGISTSSRLFISDRKLDVIAWEPNTLRGLIVSGGVLIIEYIWITSLAHHREVKAPGNFPLRSRIKMSTSWKKKMACAPSLVRLYAVRSMANLGPKPSSCADSEDSDHTVRMPRLIWVFAGRTCHFVGFVMRWLK